jgi:hypothetical protein
MGFDAETRDGHRIYWPERRTVTVVKFNFEPEEVVDLWWVDYRLRGNLLLMSA